MSASIQRRTQIVPVPAVRPSGELAELQPVAERARGYAAESRSKSTRRAYKRCWSAWTAWCGRHGLSPLPAEPEVLALYLVELADAGKAVATISEALGAVCKAHELACELSPLRPPLKEVWAGIRRKLRTKEKRRAAPLSPDLLRKMVTVGPGLGGVRDRALLLLGFAGALRRAELVALDVADLEHTEDGLIATIRFSKTDQEGKGEKVGIPFGSDRTTCPVRAVRDWLDVSGIEEGALFRSVRKSGRLGEKRLDGRDVARIVQRAAKRAGVAVERLSGHSLRSGLATTAAKAGKRTDVIMKQGRWKSAQTVAGYIRDATLLDVDNAAGGIGL